MTATRPTPARLPGRFVTLEPLTHDQLPALFRAIGTPQVFAGGYGGGPAGVPQSEAQFIEFANGYYPFETGNPYAVVLTGGPHDGELVGTSTLSDFMPQWGSTHIGWTAYDPRAWGTAVNAETKLLMLGLAFDHGFERVKLQADSLNERSRAAIAGIGATFEGVLRHDRPRADGSWRDTAVYSILADEWPDVRAGLEARLSRHGDRPVLFRSR
ncbi:GNAT family N-acetyltransferase [Lacisediminihabitans changchengi]|uniref:GNAT family N-acetyltransferase n=1 Tax=Lacisediminihabitans changchengi TaxID=2787634 RepID=A0A934SV37_9MICO|nr:GNAT family protein [Lacisediminihabitans changchengi]MBK4348584.1 GNAT family N-acetyltransferase [Lacisediminihabitans changchengi]